MSGGADAPKPGVSSQSVPLPSAIVVTAAVVERDARFLVTRRGQGVHLEGYWEFPGGKCDPHESHEQCLRREMIEELGVDVEIGPKVLDVRHEYPDRAVEIHFYRCRLKGEPRAMLNQQIQWVAREALHSLPFPPADEELIDQLTRM
jgi:8-oxo-dGTP diphosphatase